MYSYNVHCELTYIVCNVYYLPCYIYVYVYVYLCMCICVFVYAFISNMWMLTIEYYISNMLVYMFHV